MVVVMLDEVVTLMVVVKAAQFCQRLADCQWQERKQRWSTVGPQAKVGKLSQTTHVSWFARAGCFDVDVVSLFRALRVVDCRPRVYRGRPSPMTGPVKVICNHLAPVTHVVLKIAALHVGGTALGGKQFQRQLV